MAIVGQQNIGGKDKYEEFAFNYLSEVVVPHNFGSKKPSVTVIDSAGTECKGTVKYEVGQIRCTFSAPFTGTVYLN